VTASATASSEFPVSDSAPAPQGRGRTAAIVLGWMGITGQLLIVLQAFVCAPKFRAMFADFGIELSPVTLAFLAIYPVWVIAPVLSAVALVTVTRLRDSRAHGILTVAIGIMAAAFLLEAWTVLALYLPLLSLQDKLS